MLASLCAWYKEGQASLQGATLMLEVAFCSVLRSAYLPRLSTAMAPSINNPSAVILGAV